MNSTILALDRNEYFFPHHSAVQDALAHAANSESIYATRDAHADLQNQLANFLQVPSRLLAIGHGGEDLLIKILAWKRRDCQTLVRLDFSWQSYVEFATGLDYSVEEVHFGETAQGFYTPIASLQSILSAHAEPTVVIITTPNNPTGHSFSHSDVATLAELFPQHTFIIDVVYDAPNTPHLQNAVAFANVIALGSFSKFFGMPGIRVGYAVGAAIPRGFQLILGRPPPSLAAAAAALKHTDFYLQNRAIMLDFSNSATHANWNGFRVFPSLAPFFLVEINSPKISNELLQRAIQHAGARPKIFSAANRRFLRWGLGCEKTNARIGHFMNWTANNQ
jgi:histidinol-phosphate/aromatic aminotransferase/cobyric acid decarboxylase-like protein